MTATQLVWRIKFGLWALVALAFFCALVLDLPVAGLVLGSATLAITFLLRLTFVRRWLVESFVHKTPNQTAATESQTSTRPSRHQDTPLTDGEIHALLEKEARPSVMLKRVWPANAATDRNSWLGGLPRLPDSIAWPEHPRTGLALHHLAQIDLAEMPRVDTLHGLPETGMLWFFADIDEELDWPVGPDQSPTRVLYHPKSTRELPMRQVPANLPEVAHKPGEMTAHPVYLRSSAFPVYPRWPVSGHLSLTWDQDEFPEGAGWGSGYEEALAARMEAERAAILGPKPDDKPSKAVPFRFEQDDKGISRPVYEPNQEHGTFPYNHALGAEVMMQVRHEAVCQQIRDEQTKKFFPVQLQEQRENYTSLQKYTDSPDYAEKTKRISQSIANYEEAIEVANRQLATLGEVIETLDALIASLEVQGGAEALKPALQQKFDEAFQAYCMLNVLKIDPVKLVAKCRLRILQRSIDAPELQATLPANYLGGMANSYSSWSGYAEHYLLGAKGVSSNPTLGKGVRLAQFDSDYGLNFMFCDCGIIDFWIDPDDLKNGYWDRAWAATAGG